MLRVVRVVLWLGVIGVVAAAVSRHRTAPQVPVPALGQVGPFAFADKAGRAVTEQTLAGKVWVAACVFTECTESCPVLSGRMQQLQRELGDAPDVYLVSVSVDPDRDTAPKLAEYAKAFDAGDRWLFLRGSQAEVERFVTGQLGLAVAANPAPDATAGNRVLHSNLLSLIDRKGRVRGQFDGTTAAGLDELRAALAAARRE